jgi:hypothetical protein
MRPIRMICLFCVALLFASGSSLLAQNCKSGICSLEAPVKSVAKVATRVVAAPAKKVFAVKPVRLRLLRCRR